MQAHTNSKPEYDEKRVEELIQYALRSKIDASKTGEIVFENCDDMIISIGLDYLFEQGHNLEHLGLRTINKLMFSDGIIVFSHKKRGKPYSDANTSDVISGVVFKKVSSAFPEDAETELNNPEFGKIPKPYSLDGENEELHYPETGGWSSY